MTEYNPDPSTSSRRDFVSGAAAASASVAFGLQAPAVLAKTTKPLRVGVMNTFTGVSANPTQSNMNGISLYLAQNGGKIAGRKVELITADDQFNPQIGLQKVRELVESQHVDLLFGPQASNVAVAVLNYCKQSKTIMLVWAGGDSLTWGRIPILFRPSLTSWQLATPMGGWVYDNVAKEVVLVASDFVAGHDVMREFRKAFAPKGGKILKEIYPPLGTDDYSPYLTDILAIDPPALYVFLTGTDAVSFVRQFKEFGMQGKIKLTGFAPLTDGSSIPAQGDAALGALTSQIYVDTLDNAVNKPFVAEYRARYKSYPDTYTIYGYDTIQMADIALKSIDGDASNQKKLIAALSKVSFNSPRGPFKIDPLTHNPIQNVYIANVEM